MTGGTTKNRDHVTELSFVLFGGISNSFLPYSETQNSVTVKILLADTLYTRNSFCGQEERINKSLFLK